VSLWSRLTNVFRGDRLSRDIDEEIASHLEEAIEQGRDAREASRAFGSTLRNREQSRDLRVIPWLDSLRADAVFGWRQIVKRKVTSAAAVLSLALAIGACTSAFRLIDALLLRPLPVTKPGELYYLSRQGISPEGKAATVEEWAYPLFAEMRDAVKDQAELYAAGPAEQTDITYASDEEMEKVYLQYVSGGMFGSFGLQPVMGRLLTRNDDLTPSAHPVAVISYDYWSRRFSRDPNIVGRSLRIDERPYEIVGVTEPPFTGTETGTVTDVFIPTMMHPWVTRSDATWILVIARVRPGVAIEPLNKKLKATFWAFEQNRAKAFTGLSKQSIDHFLNQNLVLESAAAGVSGMQKNLRLPLVALAVLVAMVLLIACANVANLMTAQAASRAREMALRVSIGAGRWRLVQLVLVESAILAFLAASLGGWFASWASPFVIGRINPPDNPARLNLAVDWRVAAFSLALALCVMCLFGLVPALRASAVNPASAIKGGENPHSRRRLMHALIAAQVAFCFLVLFVAGLFVTTSERLVAEPLGFSAERVLILQTTAKRGQSPVVWEQVAEHLRELPGVEKVAIADWALMSGYSRNNFISINGAPPSEALAYFRYVSPGWIDAMKIRLIDGRDFRLSDTAPGAAIVNEAFAKAFLDGKNPVGTRFATTALHMGYQIVGIVADTPYRNPRESILPIAFVPVNSLDKNGSAQLLSESVFVVRTATPNPLALAANLRQEIPRARSEFRVTNIRAQTEINQRHTVRERLLAMLARFFAAVALILAAVGLYGVLDYSVVQRRREIGIRLAIGARAGDIARRVTAEVFAMVLIGAATGLALGIASVRYIEALLYQVRATELDILALPAVAILLATLLAALPPVIRAVRIDPVTMLRAD
jgi:putative ABC transport system permease protein